MTSLSCKYSVILWDPTLLGSYECEIIRDSAFYIIFNCSINIYYTLIINSATVFIKLEFVNINTFLKLEL